MRQLLLAGTAGLLGFAASFAQDEPAAEAAAAVAEDAILVLDASGSMWGQINGVTKIEIARDTIAGLLDDMPAQRHLGLMAYGHNRKGDCNDIELIAKVTDDRDAIRNAVVGLNPKGMTPLSEAVRRAAGELRYTEVKATVILVSDGIETCDVDPCALGDELEAAGVDFTAHVIGFDVAEEAEAKAQLQCLAENTGGRFLLASNADELTSALQETVVDEPPAPEPEPVTTGTLNLRATELKGGPVVESGLAWMVRQAGGGAVLFEQDDSGETVAEVPAGVVDVTATRVSDGLSGTAALEEIRPGQERTITVVLEPEFGASVRAVPEAGADANAEVVVYWEGPNRQGDYVTIAEAGSDANRYLSYTYTNSGNPLKITTPVEPGDYEIRYVLGQPRRVLASIPFAVGAAAATLAAAETVDAGAQFDVDWTGPNGQGDWVTIVAPDAGERAYTSYAYTNNGSPVELKAPLEPGDYELRYVLSGDKVIARRPIAVGAVEATVAAQAEAEVGETITVEWSGPADARDFVTVTLPDDAERKYNDYFYTGRSNDAKLKMPVQAGDYEIRYVQDGNKVLARTPITVVDAAATITPPVGARAGETIVVEWTGPGNVRDFITVVAPDEAERKFTDYFYTGRDNDSKVKMPVAPGTYELRYVLDGTRVIARTAVEVGDVDASVSGPASVAAGSEFDVAFEGPAFQRDLVTITTADAEDRKYSSYRYARNGAPARLKAPDAPGTYELRYVLDGERVIARTAIEVTAAD